MIFTDEVNFWASEGRVQGWCKKGHTPTKKFKQENQRWSFIAFMSSSGLLGIVGFTSTFDSYLFCKAARWTIEHVIRHNLQGRNAITLYIDQASAHVSNFTKLYLTRYLQIHVFVGVSKNCECNPVEYIFSKVRALQRRINDGKKATMGAKLLESWRCVTNRFVSNTYSCAMVYFFANFKRVYM